MNTNIPKLIALCIFALAPLVAEAQANGALPRLQKKGDATQLIVDGKPFLVLGGELHNSSSTSRDYMEPIWQQLVDMHLNTVLAVVPWDMVEPEEGRFDFSMVDDLVEDARRHNLKLVLLWFGSWKNGLSHYVPDWVKRDRERFPYALTRRGSPEILSVFSEENREADRRAYVAFMKHLRSIDEDEGTVIMVQIENEVGLHGDVRDRSKAANDAFAKEVPRELMNYLKENREQLRPGLRSLWRDNGFREQGSWGEVFGSSEAAEEAFMAWSYASYINALAESGKREYALPTFVNAWIVQPQDEHPGEYPSGGPQAHVLDLWQAAAPSVDLFCPDIYLPNFQEICEAFAIGGNPLFVPESRAGLQGTAQAFLAIGRFDAIGYSPFGIESHVGNFEAYETLSQIAPLVLEHQGTDRIHAVSLTQADDSETFSLGGYRLRASLVGHYRPTTPPERGYGIVMAVAPDEFVVAGGNLQVTFASDDNPHETVGLATVEEGEYRDGEWVRGRVLNGDEIMISYAFSDLIGQRQTGTALKLRGEKPSIQRATVYRYEASE